MGQQKLEFAASGPVTAILKLIMALVSPGNPSGWHGVVIGLAALGWNVLSSVLERRPRIAARQIGDSVTDRAHTQPDGRVVYIA